MVLSFERKKNYLNRSFCKCEIFQNEVHNIILLR